MEPDQHYSDNIDAFIEKVVSRERLDSVKTTYGQEGYDLFMAYLKAFGSASKLKPEERDDQIAGYLASEVTKKSLTFDTRSKFPTFTYNGKKLITVLPKNEIKEGDLIRTDWDSNGKEVTLKLDPLASEIISAASRIHGKWTKRNWMNELPPSYETRQLQSYSEEENKKFVTDDLVLHIVSAARDTSDFLKPKTFLGKFFGRN